MIIIPELKTVVILVPRTGSGSLKRAILAAYPKAMLLYRHMEADGVPHGYDQWRKVGVVRDPAARLWSLFKFMKGMRDYRPETMTPERAQLLADSTACGFSKWVLTNTQVFASPHGVDGKSFHASHSVMYLLPENRKSQFLYLRPDLGTKIYSYNYLSELAFHLRITLPYSNRTGGQDVHSIYMTDAAIRHIEHVFAWDLEIMRSGPIDPAFLYPSGKFISFGNKNDHI